jgi:methionyl-tRNA synthetase
MIDKYYDGVVPEFKLGVTEFDDQLEQTAITTVEKVEAAMENMEFSVALQAIWALIGRTNKYIDETKPWALAKDEGDKAALASVMGHLAESLRFVSILIQPFITQTPSRIWTQLGVAEGEWTVWESLRVFDDKLAGIKVGKGDPIFPRLEMADEVSWISNSMTGGKAAPTPVDAGATTPVPSVDEKLELKPEISIDEFAQVELRVAQVVGCEPIPKADKLLKLQLDLGYEVRQVVSGIAKFYKPDELIGRKVICVTNLKPVKLRGELSQGMILAASQGDQLTLATVPDNMPNGALVK